MLILLGLMGCVTVGPDDTADTGAECAEVNGYIMFTDPDCSGVGYAAERGAGEITPVVSYYRVADGFCYEIDAFVVGGIEACE